MLGRGLVGSVLLLPLDKSSISSGGSYKNVSVSFGVVIYGWIMLAQQPISQHETDRLSLTLSLSLSLSSRFLLKRSDVSYKHTASVDSLMASLTLGFMKKSLYNCVALIRR
jgi:hypothetical protein